MSKKILQLLRKTLLVLIVAIFSSTSVHLQVFALDVDELSDYYTGNDIHYRDATACGGAASPGASMKGLDKFLQVLAYQETRENYYINGPGYRKGLVSPTGAKGKYQYIDSTWQGVIRNNKMPWDNYTNANAAPVPVQDAVAFIEYSKKFKSFKNDIFKLAVSHFYPAANDNPALLDINPPGNPNMTPRKYANNIKDMIDTEGPWSKIPLNYTEAPGFEEAARKNGIDPNAGSTSGAGGSPSGLTYIDVGTGKNLIPAKGKEVGGSTFGGRWDAKSKKWVATNDLEYPAGKGKTNDDSGIGNRDNKLPGSSAYAELSISPAKQDFSALGNLPNGTKLAITYKDTGKTVIAQKGDVGAGGLPSETKQRMIEGQPLAIDIFYDVARLLDFKNGSDVVTIRGVDPSTPLTPVGGDALTDASDTAAENDCNQPCDESTATGDIFLDPGHSKEVRQGQKDPETGLMVGDNDGAPGERAAMWKTAEIVRKDLETSGYRVVMSKKGADSPAHVGLRERAEMANKSKAALAVSLHYDGNHSFGSWGEIYDQRLDLSRYNGKNRANELFFKDEDLAKASGKYAQIFKEERTKAEGVTPSVTKANFSDRGKDYSGGDIPMVQLFSKVPWVYLEAGAKGFNAEKYAAGITAAIKRIVTKPSGDGNTTAEACMEGNTNGDIAKTAISYAWPTRAEALTKPPKGYNTDPISLYAAVLKKFNKTIPPLGRDCGYFVGAVMWGSGADKKYPDGYTPEQYRYVTKSGKYDIKYNVKDTRGEHPGDIYIAGGETGGGSNGHTLFWIGSDKPGSKQNNLKADASYFSRTGGLAPFALDNRTWIRARLK